MNYTFWKRKKPLLLTRQFVWRQIFCGFRYCASEATKRQSVSPLSVQQLPVSQCVAKHCQCYSLIFHKLRNTDWGSAERTCSFSKSLTLHTINICTRSDSLFAKNYILSHLLRIALPRLVCFQETFNFVLSFLPYTQENVEFCNVFTIALHISSSGKPKSRAAVL